MKLLAALILLQSPDGWAELKGKERIEVYRDSFGVPHVFAASVEDAFFAEGWLEAEDRLFQMEKFRRAAKGTAAALFGREALGGDLEEIRRGYTEEELRRMFDGSSERFRTCTLAYCAGVNAFLKAGRLPAAYAELKQAPAEWTPTDCVAVGIMMARDFGEGGETELHFARAFDLFKAAFGEEKATLMLRDLLRDTDPSAPTTVDDPPLPPKDEKHNFLPAAPDGEWYASWESSRQAAADARERLGLRDYSGSNAWLLSSKKSASGRAILYAGPMMGFKTPSICNQVHLSAPGLNIAGMSFPGVPGVMIGFNERLAWTTTSGGADLIDVYVLELHPEDDNRYRYRGEWKDFETVEFERAVAGGEPVKERVRRSVYGPLVGSIDVKKRRAWSSAMSFWKREIGTLEAVMDINVASSVDEAAKAVSKITTTHNWFIADRDGRIGFWFAGAHPVRRKGHDPRFPQAGDGSMDWEGILPFEKWPQSVDPARGFFANWNNKPSRDWEPSIFGRVFWGKRIGEVLAAKEKLTFDETVALAREAADHDFLADYFLPFMIEAADAETAARLKAYGRMRRDGDLLPAAVERWVDIMTRKIFDELGPALEMRPVKKLTISPVLYVLEGEKSPIKMKYDWVGKLDLKAAARDALAEVMKGKPWETPEINFKGKVGKVASPKGRGTFQMAVELGPDGPRAVTIAPPGQSEDESSPHYADQVPMFRDWQYRPFPFRRDEMK